MYTSLNHNVMASNTARNLNQHYANLATSTRRLSSGLRINSSADDAVGLAIRELQRADIAALHQGARNANDAISMIQVADGALGIIDEKLIRMKELAEQAATGTYNSTQRLMIDSEFQAMASEIERIANATDFNGIKLLDGSRSGKHDGSGMQSKGALKVHFGSGNDSAEDYYYIEIGDCTLKGLGLTDEIEKGDTKKQRIENEEIKNDIDMTLLANNKPSGEAPFEASGITKPILNDNPWDPYTNLQTRYIFNSETDPLENINDVLPKQGEWYFLDDRKNAIWENFMCIIPKGSKNVVINTGFNTTRGDNTGLGAMNDHDIHIFTKDGKHLVGGNHINVFEDNDIEKGYDEYKDKLGFSYQECDHSMQNIGPQTCDGGNTLNYSTYNGMTIGYSGDNININGNAVIPAYSNDYEIVVIDEVTEDLIFWLPGVARTDMKYFMDLPSTNPDSPPLPDKPNPDDPDTPLPDNEIVENIISIKTQETAQKALTRINDAIVSKDKIRAHLGAIQNRLENTISNLNIQAENLQAAESRISDVDVATEMTNFVRNQILTQSSVAMLGQANSMPQMLMQLISG